eukprot:161640_1
MQSSFNQELTDINTPCRYFGSAAGCRYGNSCYYSHDNPNSVPLCKYYLSSSGCARNNKCYYRHSNRRIHMHSLHDHSYNHSNNNHHNDHHSRTEKIYSLLQQHGNCMKLSQLIFIMLYPQQCYIPNLLTYLVQLPHLLVMKCLNDEDIMIFYRETSVHRTVIDILRDSQQLFENENNKNTNNDIEYKGMEIEQFTLCLAEKLNITSLSDCNIVDFLERWGIGS